MKMVINLNNSRSINGRQTFSTHWTEDGTQTLCGLSMKRKHNLVELLPLRWIYVSCKVCLKVYEKRIK